MYVLDKNIFIQALKKSGFRSITELSDFIGVHRNTIQYFLSGKNVLPESVDKVLEVLELSPKDAFTKKKPFKKDGGKKQIAFLVDMLHEKFPDITFILIGSRAKNKSRKYSDWDIGCYSKKGVSHSIYRKMLILIHAQVESLAFYIDLVNLNNAPLSFLKEVSKGWKFLSGKQMDWITLKDMAGYD